MLILSMYFMVSRHGTLTLIALIPSPAVIGYSFYFHQRVHDGIDIAAGAGTPVHAAAEGTVTAVYEDDAMGCTVEITHVDGYVTSYSSLEAPAAVAVGDTVTLGQAIGTVGNTALLETATGDHLHFSVSCNGVVMDPELFFQLG